MISVNSCCLSVNTIKMGVQRKDFDKQSKQRSVWTFFFSHIAVSTKNSGFPIYNNDMVYVQRVHTYGMTCTRRQSRR